MRIPIKYIANMLCAGNEEPIQSAMKKLVGMRNLMRNKFVGNEVIADSVYEDLGLTALQIDEMYRYLALAPYEERFVIPSVRTDHFPDTFATRSESGFEKPHGKERSKNLMGGL